MREVVAALWERDVIPDYRDPGGLRVGLSPLSTSYDEVDRGIAAVRELLGVSPANEHGQPVGDPLDWTPRPMPVPVVLTGRYVTVSGLEHRHADALYDALAAPEDDALWTYRFGERPPTQEAMAAAVAGMLAHPTDVTFVVTPHGRGPEGLATLMRVDAANGVGRGRQHHPGALRCSARRPRPRRCTCWPTTSSTPSATAGTSGSATRSTSPRGVAAARLGFTYEGRFRNAMVYKGRNRDTDWFSITDAEWPRDPRRPRGLAGPRQLRRVRRPAQRLGDLTAVTPGSGEPGTVGRLETVPSSPPPRADPRQR